METSIPFASVGQFDPLHQWRGRAIRWLFMDAVFFGVELLLLLLMVNFNLSIIPMRAQIEIGVPVVLLPIIWITSLFLVRRAYQQSILRRHQILHGLWRERAQFQPEGLSEGATPQTPILLDLRLNLAWIIPHLIIIALCLVGILALSWSLYTLWSDLKYYAEHSSYITFTTNIPLDTWITYMFLIIIWLGIWIALRFFANIQLRRWLCPELEATEEGLTAFYPGRQVTLAWNAIRYFVVVKKHKSSPVPDDWTFEVSDGEQIIRWQQPYIAKRVYSLYVPVLPRETYEDEFDNLLSLITIKTGLPLLDMRIK